MSERKLSEDLRDYFSPVIKWVTQPIGRDSDLVGKKPILGKIANPQHLELIAKAAALEAEGETLRDIRNRVEEKMKQFHEDYRYGRLYTWGGEEVMWLTEYILKGGNFNDEDRHAPVTEALRATGERAIKLEAEVTQLRAQNENKKKVIKELRIIRGLAEARYMAAEARLDAAQKLPKQWRDAVIGGYVFSDVKITLNRVADELEKALKESEQHE